MSTLAESFSGTAALGAPPKSLFGYELIEHLGDGAGSRIYAVTHPETHQVYALKHVVRKGDKDARFVDQLEAEYEVGRHVAHPGLRKSIDLKFDKSWLGKVNSAALVMELVDGEPLETNLPAGDVRAIVRIFLRTAEAMHGLHQMGYVHCDLKPNNILLQSDGGVKVIDLGQAVKTGTVKERIQGTPDYIAPEQVKRDAVTFRTDVFNYGATFYWALCGGKKLPTLFTIKKGDNSFLLDSAIPTPASCNDRVPENLSNLVMECVRTNPAKRPADFTEVSRRLELIDMSLERAERTGHQG